MQPGSQFFSPEGRRDGSVGSQAVPFARAHPCCLACVCKESVEELTGPRRLEDPDTKGVNSQRYQMQQVPLQLADAAAF